MKSMQEAADEFDRALTELLRTVAEALMLPRFAAWLNAKLGWKSDV
jgi:hypothetical protein